MNFLVSTATPNTQPESPLAAGNHALRSGDYAAAVGHYLRALQATPALGKTIGANLAMARQKYRVDRANIERNRVAVCGWELAHNAAGRVYTLAKLYETFADVEIIGSIFPMHGRDVWEPIRNTTIPRHTFVVDDQSRFIEQAIELVAAHPYDIVHLSKPRAPNIFFGILYKLIWDAKVLVDIDDEELAFVGAETSISIDDYLKAHDKLPELKDLADKDWTRLAVGLAKEFDGITVSNPVLQQRYGGEIIRHARDEKRYQPSPEFKYKSRERFGIPQDKKVVLFFGTPSEHKGLIETADAIAALKRKDILFTIVGDFLDPALKSKLQAKKDVEYVFIGNQQFDNIPEVVAIGDFCVFLQDPDSPASMFQVPAKLSDALGMQLLVLASYTPPLEELFACGALIKIDKNSLAEILGNLLSNIRLNKNELLNSIDYFNRKISFYANAPKLNRSCNFTAYAVPSERSQLDNAGITKAIELMSGKYTVLEQLANLINHRSNQANPKIGFQISQPLEKLAGLRYCTRRDVFPDSERIAVVVHYFYPEIWSLIGKRLKAISNKFDLFITAPVSMANSAISDVLRDFPSARFHFGPNAGMDIIPFLSLIPILINERYLAVCKLQTKRGDGGLAEIWRDIMLDSLIGSSENFSLAARTFAEDESVCLIGPAALYQSGPRIMYDNLSNLVNILDKVYGEAIPDSDWGFFAGTMFWARTEILAPLSQLANFSLENIDGEYKKDGKIEHALERFFGLLARVHSGKVGLLQQISMKKIDCCLLLTDSFTSIGQAHIGDVMRQYSRLEADVKTIEESGIFDKEYYVNQAPELRGVDMNFAVHYLTQGTYRGLSPNKTFRVKQEILRFLRERGDERDPFIFYIENGADETCVCEIIKNLSYKKFDIFDENLIKDSGLFDREYYIQQCPTLNGLDVDLVKHYLTEGVYNQVYPSRYFIPREYQALNSDVVKAGIEPFFHYITRGALERRRYRETLRREEEESPFYRFIVLNSALIDWRFLGRSARDKDLVSIVIPIYGQMELTRDCIQSILNSRVESKFEIVCVDNGSDANTANLLKHYESSYPEIKLVSNPENYNFALGCNLGFAKSSGSIVVFLNNDTTVTPGWIDMLVIPLADDTIGAVQPKLVYPDGTIQCAGVVFSGKNPLGYPLYAGVAGNEPCVNKSRNVQAITAACIGLRAKDFITLKGFDPTFINGQEDVDFCLRLTRSTNRKCWYEANALVYHHESRTPGRGKYIALNRRTFVERWRGKVKVDDYKYYAEDKYQINNWTVDNEDFLKQGIGISRPVLEQIKVSRVYFTWDKKLEATFASRIYAIERQNGQLYDDIRATIIMPTYNRQDLITSAIKSVLVQSHKNLELLVIDDGSTDETSKVMSNFDFDGRIKYIKTPHSGVSSARNTGLDLSSGEYIFYLDSDNKWNIDFVRNMLVFLTHGSLDAAYSGIQIMDDNGDITCYRGDVFDWSECLKENYVDLNSFAHSRKLADKLRFDQSLARMVDWDFILRLTKNNRVAYAPFLGVSYYDGDKNNRITRTEYQGSLLKKMQVVIRAKHSDIQDADQLDNKNNLDWTELFPGVKLGASYTNHANSNQDLIGWQAGGHEVAKESNSAFQGINTLNFPKSNALKFRIKIGTPSIAVCEEWGDYHYARAIQRALQKHGHRCEIDCLDRWEDPGSSVADVVLVLRGLSKYKPKQHQTNLMWNISHPDKISDDEYLEYDHIFVASELHAMNLEKRLSTSVSCLLQATDPSIFNPFVGAQPSHEILFVGNSRNIYRAIIKDCIDAKLPVSLYGTRWESFVEPIYIKGQNIPNSILGGYYASAGVVLNDHWDSMQEFGFISNRLFDAAACATRIISDNVNGIENLFGDYVVTYGGGSQLLGECVRAVSARDPIGRKARLAFAEEIRAKHSFDARVCVILDVTKVLLARRSEGIIKL